MVKWLLNKGPTAFEGRREPAPLLISGLPMRLSRHPPSPKSRRLLLAPSGAARAAALAATAMGTSSTHASPSACTGAAWQLPQPSAAKGVAALTHDRPARLLDDADEP